MIVTEKSTHAGFLLLVLQTVRVLSCFPTLLNAPGGVHAGLLLYSFQLSNKVRQHLCVDEC